MTISQLREYLTTKGWSNTLCTMDLRPVRLIEPNGSRLRTTKSYWNSRCGELLDMVQQIGDPTVFFTLSAADYYWPNLFRPLGKDVNKL
ncbi:Serine--pyruvate aminotransferase, mitochondrial [Frankliniella fusca]|uniref:Serine--pyruvate aminotransferase, mitochondrial n=1 Tax=Frankliniella fusca TaxID=407009 RepID=A0AAE1LEH8_9NEOP|nr:Serine--pyruvate aminotransferase, mitochondrial [Frankliniella fusca]